MKYDRMLHIITMECAISRMKMSQARDSAISVMSDQTPQSTFDKIASYSMKILK